MLTKVLLIDDSVTIHRVIDLSIDLEKFEIMKVFSKQEAVAKLSQNSYDYILLDNKLDNVHIIDYIKELKSSYPSCKVILLVGAFDRFTDADLKITSADDFLVKPFDSQSLNSKLSDKTLGYVSSATPQVDMAPEIEDKFDEVITAELQPADNSNQSLPEMHEIALDDINLDDDINQTVAELTEPDKNLLAPDEVIDDEIATNKFLDTALFDTDIDEDLPVTDDDIDIPDIDITELTTSDEDSAIISHTTDPFADINNLDVPEFIDTPEKLSDDDNKSSVDENIFDNDTALIEDELDVMRRNLDLAFIDKDDKSNQDKKVADQIIKPVVEENKPKVKRSNLSYFGIDNEPKPKVEEKLDDDDLSVHKELVGNILYDEVIMPSLHDEELIDTKKTNVKQVAQNNIDISDTATGNQSTHTSKDILYEALRDVLSKEFVESSIRDILAKNIKEAVKDIIPNLAEKYILEEIERLKEDDKED